MTVAEEIDRHDCTCIETDEYSYVCKPCRLELAKRREESLQRWLATQPPDEGSDINF